MLESSLLLEDIENIDEAEMEAIESLLRAEEAQKGLESLYFFDKYLLGYKDMQPKTHLPLCNFMDDTTIKRKKHAEFPRGTFKSSVITIGYTIQQVAKNPDVRILIDNEVYGNSKAFLREIKSHLERPDLLELYPHIAPNKRINDGFTESSVIVSGRTKHLKESTISCAGLDQIKVGMHYDIIIMDDLVSTRNVTTKEQIDKVIEHYKLALSLLEPGGILVVVGTRYHYTDLYGFLLDNEGDTFEHLIVPAKLDEETARDLNNRFPEIVGRYGLYKADDLLFPERLTEEFLKDQRQSQGSYIFNCQYLLNPVNAEEADFKREWLRYYRGHVEDIPGTDRKQLVVNWVGDHKKAPLDGYTLPFTVPISITTTFDPNNKKKKKSDNTGAITLGSTPDNNWFILDLIRDKYNPGQIVDKIFETQERFEPEVMGIEEVGKETIKYYLLEKMKKLGKFFRIKELKTGGVVKEDRIKRLIPRFEFGTIFLPVSCIRKDWEGKTIDIVEAFEDEYEYFPLAKKDDLMDALAYQETLIPKAKKKAKQKVRRKGKARLVS